MSNPLAIPCSHTNTADARIVLCANKSDGEVVVRKREGRELSEMFGLPLLYCSQLSPRAGSPFYTMAKLLEYGPSLMPPKKVWTCCPLLPALA